MRSHLSTRTRTRTCILCWSLVIAFCQNAVAFQAASGVTSRTTSAGITSSSGTSTRTTTTTTSTSTSTSTGRRNTLVSAAPVEALPDIVIPNVVDFSAYSHEISTDELQKEDPRIWVPQTDCLSFRPLCFCTSQGYYVNLLKFKGGGILGRHRHSSPVHALTLKGNWGYKEHDWNAGPGTYVFEPPGETHTLLVDEDCDEMVTLFHVTGSLLYIDECNDDQVIGFDDVFSKLDKAKKWYTECGLGEDYVQQFVR